MIKIVVVDGVGGSGKTTLLDTLEPMFESSPKNTVMRIKFPLDNEDADKQKLKEDTEKTPVSTAMRMVTEQAMHIGATASLFNMSGKTGDLILLIDRAWVSTLVYQLGDRRFNLEQFQLIFEEMIKESLKEIGLYDIFYFIAHPVDVGTVVERKWARMAHHTHASSADRQLKQLQESTFKIYDKFDTAVGLSKVSLWPFVECEVKATSTQCWFDNAETINKHCSLHYAKLSYTHRATPQMLAKTVIDYMVKESL